MYCPCSVCALLLLFQEFLQFHHQLVERLRRSLDLDSLAEMPKPLSFLRCHRAASWRGSKSWHRISRVSVGVFTKLSRPAFRARRKLQNVAIFVDRPAALVRFCRFQGNRLSAYRASWFRTAVQHPCQIREWDAVQIMDCQGSASRSHNPLLSCERNCWGLGLLTYRINPRQPSDQRQNAPKYHRREQSTVCEVSNTRAGYALISTASFSRTDCETAAG